MAKPQKPASKSTDKFRVVFDCQGSLNGPPKVKQLYFAFNILGAHITIWSGVYGIATRTAASTRPAANDVLEKDFTGEKGYKFDIAIDDDTTQTFPGVKRMVYVDEIPENAEEILEFAKKLIAGA